MEVVSIKVLCFHDGTYASNCYLAVSDDEQSAVVIDPSVSYDFVFRQRDKIPEIKKILLTHAHFDHVLYLDEWKEKTQASVCITKEDAPSLNDGEKNAYSFFFGESKTYGEADELLSDGDIIHFGCEKLSLLHTPGHTCGSCCYIGDGIIFTGDTLFADGGVGRTDLYSGNSRELFSSLKRILSLNKNYKIYPGHGADSTIEEEKLNHGFYAI